MGNEKIYQMDFSKVYHLLVSKAEKKGRMRQEVDEVIRWLTGYSQPELERMLEKPSMSRDKITGGYARLFSDYAVAMVMSVLPVFPAVLMCMKDRRAKMAEMIYTRKVSAAKVIITRYLAIITAVMIPVIILSYVSNSSETNYMQ